MTTRWAKSEKIGRKRAVDMITTRLEHQSGFASKEQNIDDIPPYSKKTSLESRIHFCFEQFGLIIVSWNSYTRQSDVAVERPSVILWYKQSRYTDRYLCIWIIYKVQGFFWHSFCKWAIWTIGSASSRVLKWGWFHWYEHSWAKVNLAHRKSNWVLHSCFPNIKHLVLLARQDPHLCEVMQRLSFGMRQLSKFELDKERLALNI